MSPEVEPQPYHIELRLEELVFGAIALNLVFLMCMVIHVGGYLAVMLVYGLFANYLRGLTLFGIGVAAAALVSQLVQACLWGARGFLEVSPVRIMSVGIFFVLYGLSGIHTGAVDGYVALGTVVLTIVVIGYSRGRQFLSYVQKLF